MPLSIEQFEAAVSELACAPDVDWRRSACGVTRPGREIVTLEDRDFYEEESNRIRVALVGGLSGTPHDVEIALRAVRTIALGIIYLTTL